MEFQILPNWSKKLGLSVFVVFELLTVGDSFMDGFYGMPYGSHTFFKDLYGENLYSVFYALPLIGLLIYMLSKEKIEDDYIKLIRLQSYQTGIVVLLLIALIIFLFDITFEISLGMAISIFMMLFLVIFYFKKRIDQ